MEQQADEYMASQQGHNSTIKSPVGNSFFSISHNPSSIV